MKKHFPTVRKLIIGTNVLENFERLVEIGSHQPLIVRGGRIPMVTINISMNGSWISLVEDNVSNSPSINVYENFPKRTVDVMSAGITIFSATTVSSEQEVEVSKLDLRSIGWNIFLDKGCLNLGDTKLSNNRFRDVNTVFKFGE